jgi:cytochrome P450
MNTDPDLWPGHTDLRAFRPERWLDGSPIPSCAVHFPFGGGKTICPGSRLAMLQLKMMISYLACMYVVQLARPMPRVTRLAVGPEKGAWFRMTPVGRTP